MPHPHPPAPPAVEPLISPRELARRLGLTTPGVFRLVAQGNCPAPARLSPRTLRWSETTIRDWLESRPAWRSPEDTTAPRRPRANAQ